MKVKIIKSGNLKWYKNKIGEIYDTNYMYNKYSDKYVYHLISEPNLWIDPDDVEDTRQDKLKYLLLEKENNLIIKLYKKNEKILKKFMGV